MVEREHTFCEIVTFDYPMWRKSYAAGTFRAIVEEYEGSEKAGRGKIVKILSVERPKLYDDYTDLHGGVDSLSKSTTAEDIKKLFEGKEGTYEHDEGYLPPRHMFKLKDQFPIEIKPSGMPFG
uniref:Uncharacterized protein n=1 Tax=Candidatus Methanomethylicus mesodigestus TaxID=1867258 RepID=A0A7C3J4T4_9CREN